MLPLQNQNSNYLNPPNTNSQAIIASGKTQMRPSSPRQFFARLYGHLETNTDEGISPPQRPASVMHSESNLKTLTTFDSPATCDTNYQSDGATTASSPDISISDERCVCLRV